MYCPEHFYGRSLAFDATKKSSIWWKLCKWKIFIDNSVEKAIDSFGVHNRYARVQLTKNHKYNINSQLLSRARLSNNSLFGMTVALK